MPKSRQVYLDTAAATPEDSRVRQAMAAYSRRHFANPSSLHGEGVAAARALAHARARVARVLGAHADEIIFTGGGTEANNLAIFGIMTPVGHFVSKRWTRSVQQMLSTTIEHASVLEPARKIESAGGRVIYLPVNNEGLIDLKKFKESLTPKTKLVSIIYAHNEIGVIQPVREIAKIIRHFKAKTLKAKSFFPLLYLDACQAPRFLDLDVARLGVDLMTLNGSKIYGPSGTGCLYVRREIELTPLLYGGGQEGGRRSGTENVAGAVGLATALEICASEREKESARLTKLRDQLIVGLLKIDGVTLNGPAPDSDTERLPNNVNVSIAGVEGEQVVLELDARGVACSTGAACSIPERDDSHVIMALGKTKEEAESAVRFTLGRDTTRAEVNYALKILPPILEKLRGVKFS